MRARVRLDNQIDAVRALLSEVRKEPYIEESRLVLADWLEEKGISNAASVLRLDPDESGPELMVVLSAIGALFGEKRVDDSVRQPGRYTGVLGLPVALDAGDTRTFEGECFDFLKLRRLVIPRPFAFSVTIVDLRVGNRALFLSAEPVSGSLFVLEAPETFDDTLAPRQRIILTVRNDSNVTLTTSFTFLGSPVDRTFVGSMALLSDREPFEP